MPQSKRALSLSLPLILSYGLTAHSSSAVSTALIVKQPAEVKKGPSARQIGPTDTEGITGGDVTQKHYEKIWETHPHSGEAECM